MAFTEFPITTADSALTGAQGVAALQKAHDMPSAAAVTSVVQTAPAVKQTLDDAITFAQSGLMVVGGVVNTLEYNAGTEIGGNSYTLVDAGSSGARPADDGGSVIHVTGGSGGLHLKGLFLEGVFLEQFGALGDYDDALDTGTDNSPAFAAFLAYESDVHRIGSGKSFKVLQTLNPAKKIKLIAGGANIYQRDITKPLFNLVGMDGSTFDGGNYSHNMNISDYDVSNGKLFYGEGASTDNLTFYNARIFKTAQQGIVLNDGGENFQALLCDFEETARDSIFLLDCTSPRVSLCTFKNSGDDSLVAAGQSTNAIFSNNVIDGAGSYNIGGSGIRANRSGVISGNTITNSDLFGIIAAVNTIDTTARPENLHIVNNYIKGINQTGTVTAGIGFKDVTSVWATNNTIIMNSKEAKAYRSYGAGSEFISISGGSVENAEALFYTRESACTEVSITGVRVKNTTDTVLIDSTGPISRITFKGNTVDNPANSGYLRFTSGATTVVSSLETENNKLVTPNAVVFVYNNKSVTKHLSINDQWATGLYSDYSSSGNVGSLIINGRYGEDLSYSGVATFNATNSGLIAHGLAVAPLYSEIVTLQQSSLGSAKNWYIDYVDSVNYRIRLDAAPVTDVTFYTKIRAYDNRKVI